MLSFVDTRMCETCCQCELCMARSLDKIYPAWNYGDVPTHLCQQCSFWCVEHRRWETREVLQQLLPAVSCIVGICDEVCSRCGGRAELPRIAPHSHSICVPCAATFLKGIDGLKEKSHSL